MVNKETVLGLCREQRYAGKIKLNTGRKEAESERIHVAPLETDLGMEQAQGLRFNTGGGRHDVSVPQPQTQA